MLIKSTGGQIGHRKYDCPEQRNFTANIICRVCGNAGHMARDCPDRQRGSDNRNHIPGAPPQRRLGPSDAVDQEMEVCQSGSLSEQILT
jgi:splicing factor 1